MKEDAEILAAIDTNLRESINLPPILLGLANPLPEESVLVDLNMQLKKKIIQFSVMTPTDKHGSMTAGQIIELWKKEGTLGSYLREIRAETSQREYRSGHPVILHRFSASFVTKQGGA